MNKKSIELDAKNIIIIFKTLNTDITKYWKIIRNQNIMSKKEIAAGLRTYDLKELYNKITQLQQKRILIKGILNALNNGITDFNYTDFKKTNNYSIFAACEYKEEIAQLKLIPTINPTEKSKKGLKGLYKSEIFTSAKIASLIKKAQLNADKYDANLEKFNNETTIKIKEAEMLEDIIS